MRFFISKDRRVTLEFSPDTVDTPDVDDLDPKRYRKVECDVCIFLNGSSTTVVPGCWEKCNACDGHGWNWVET